MSITIILSIMSFVFYFVRCVYVFDVLFRFFVGEWALSIVLTKGKVNSHLCG